MAKKKKHKILFVNPIPQGNNMLQVNNFNHIKNSEETYQIQNRRIVGPKKPKNKPNSSSHLYNDGGMAFDRFEYGLD